MTLTGRNLSLRFAFTVLVLVSLTVVAAFGSALQGVYFFDELQLSLDVLLAVTGTFITVGLGWVLSAAYLRLFRRTPSLSVFFVTWFFLMMIMDVFKLGMVFLPVTPWPQLGPEFSRVVTVGHVSGVMALFGAGLYAGGLRMQRHGTAILVGGVIAVALSWSIPIDTSFVPDHLVYRAGIRSSLQATLFLLLTVAVINFVQASIYNGAPRQLISAGAVAALAVGRELLFYRVEPIWIGLGAFLVVTGGIVFAGHNYRDFLLS
ncbi:MAG: hypothetical protein ACOCYB_05945 [Alkalispirochaeta sp.]